MSNQPPPPLDLVKMLTLNYGLSQAEADITVKALYDLGFDFNVDSPAKIKAAIRQIKLNRKLLKSAVKLLRYHKKKGMFPTNGKVAN